MADPSSRSGIRYADAAVLEFASRVHAPHDDALQRAFDAPQRHGMPPIQVGPSEGKLLALLLQMIEAERVVEIGTLAGYSAAWMARVLPPSGMLYTIEADPAHAEVARATLREAGLADRVTVLTGLAAELLPQLSQRGPFDAVFLDADKAGYLEYARWAAEQLRPGGLLIADNAYLFGELLHDSDEARAVRAFHEQLPVRFDSVCIPTPDGLVLAVRR